MSLELSNLIDLKFKYNLTIILIFIIKIIKNPINNVFMHFIQLKILLFKKHIDGNHNKDIT